MEEMEILPLIWEARIRCVMFWYKLCNDHRYHQRLVQRLALSAMRTPGIGCWIRKLRACFSDFGWQDYECVSLSGISGGQLREMLYNIAARQVERVWAEDLDRRAKLSILNSMWVNGLTGRCWKIKEKSQRRALMMLRGGSAALQIETGRWRGIPREERLCRECGSDREIESASHFLPAALSKMGTEETASFKPSDGCLSGL